MKGRGEKILYLDFDGVLHHEACYRHPRKGPYLKAPATFRLFEHAELLAAELEPFPQVLIVLSTSWVIHFGFSSCVQRLPAGLQSRCIGATFHSRMSAGAFIRLPRGVQVHDDVERRSPANWIALDDDLSGWSPGDKWVHTDPVLGIGSAGVLGRLQEALLDMCLPLDENQSKNRRDWS